MNSPWTLSQLVTHLTPYSPELVGDPDTAVSNLALSSRDSAALKDAIFAAVPGTNKDGHAFIPAALAGGAKAVLGSNSSQFQNAPGIAVNDVRAAVSALSDLMCGEPSKNLAAIGITGTNGKTTTNWLVFHLLRALGWGTARLGTLGSAIHDNAVSGELTTPDAPAVQQFLSQALSAGCRAAVMEVSSHALHQRRAEHVRFDVAVFTNLTRDHLDYHRSFEEYYLAKLHLFELLAQIGKGARTAVINIDDQAGAKVEAYCRAIQLPVIAFGRGQKASLLIEDFVQSQTGSTLTLREGLKSYRLRAPFIGEHNAENIAAAFGVCRALGFKGEQVAEHLRAVPQVPGRLELVGKGGGHRAIYVDYAHTPDALERVLRALRPITPGRLVVLFGCGGDRDRGKRPQMGALARRLADTVYVTSDNPRTEDPQVIIDEILAGIEDSREIKVEVDRRQAISQAVAQLSAGDTLLIAGKGHEDYQVIGTTKHHFSDVEEAERAIKGK